MFKQKNENQYNYTRDNEVQSKTDQANFLHRKSIQNILSIVSSVVIIFSLCMLLFYMQWMMLIALIVGLVFFILATWHWRSSLLLATFFALSLAVIRIIIFRPDPLFNGSNLALVLFIAISYFIFKFLFNQHKGNKIFLIILFLVVFTIVDKGYFFIAPIDPSFGSSAFGFERFYGFLMIQTLFTSHLSFLFIITGIALAYIATKKKI